MERMRRQYAALGDTAYTAISSHEEDYRARRITAYLNLVHRIVQKQTSQLKTSPFEAGSGIVKYFEMLADRSPLKGLYRRMKQTDDAKLRSALQDELRRKVLPGAIDVNIMTKLDKNNKRKGEQLPPEYSDALAALRGFLRSELDSAVVLSAGMNPRLFAYMGSCPEFLPGPQGGLRKKIILKVSDFRSAMIQGKLLARKGLWVSENCTPCTGRLSAKRVSLGRRRRTRCVLRFREELEPRRRITFFSGIMASMARAGGLRFCLSRKPQT
jgi:hypothetical protein